MLHMYGDVLDTKWLERIFETVINFAVCVYSWDSVYFDFVFVVLKYCTGICLGIIYSEK